MQAASGDRLRVRGHMVGQSERVGEIVEVRGAGGNPPYLVRFDDGYTSLVFAGPDGHRAFPEEGKEAAGGRLSNRREAAGADRGRADPVAELGQLGLDPPVPAAVILAGEPPDQHGDPGADRRPSRPVRTGPLPGDEAAVPAQHGTRGDQPVCPQAPGQGADQRGEDRTVGPVQAGPGMGSRHGYLVPQREQFDVRRRR